MARWPKPDYRDGKIQPSERYYEVVFVFRRAARLCVPKLRLWPTWRDDHSGVLIGAGGMRPSGWPDGAQANAVSAGIDR